MHTHSFSGTIMLETMMNNNYKKQQLLFYNSQWSQRQTVGNKTKITVEITITQ